MTSPYIENEARKLGIMLLLENKLDLDQFYKWLNPDLPHEVQFNRHRLLSQAVEVTEEVYDHFLGMLPPMNFTSSGFAMCEATTDDLRLAFFRIKGRFFAAEVSDTDGSRSMKATRELIEVVI
jgi:hypothetical protein